MPTNQTRKHDDANTPDIERVMFPDFNISIDGNGLSITELKAAHDALKALDRQHLTGHPFGSAGDFMSDVYGAMQDNIEHEMARSMPENEAEAVILSNLWLSIQKEAGHTAFDIPEQIAATLVKWIKAVAAQPQTLQAAE